MIRSYDEISEEEQVRRQFVSLVLVAFGLGYCLAIVLQTTHGLHSGPTESQTRELEPGSKEVD